MTRLDRVTAKVFADSAPASEIGQFGSALLGTKVLTDDVATIQGLTAYENGWGSAVISTRNYPTMQEFNGILKVMSYQTAYQMQEGIPEYDASTTYYQGSIVKVISGTDVYFYSSLIDNNTGYAVTNTNYWQALTYVKTTGDTMTGRLNLDIANLNSSTLSALSITCPNIDFTTAPPTQYYAGLVVLGDKYSNRMGRIEYEQNTDGEHHIALVDKKSSTENVYSQIKIGFWGDGTAYCDFPNTKCVDGQWVASLHNLASNVSVYGSSNITYSLASYLPNDGQAYEVLINCRVQADTSSASYWAPVYIGSALTANNFIGLTGVRTLVTGQTNQSNGATVIPVGTDHKITLVRSTSYHGTIETIDATAYRRIGTNA